jgi:hypothetical protein
MHLPINVKSPNNISKWHMGFNSAFKGLISMPGTFNAEQIRGNYGYRLILNIIITQNFFHFVWVNYERNQQDAFFFAVALRPNAGHGLIIFEVSRSHKTTHHSR